MSHINQIITSTVWHQIIQMSWSVLIKDFYMLKKNKLLLKQNYWGFNLFQFSIVSIMYKIFTFRQTAIKLEVKRKLQKRNRSQKIVKKLRPKKTKIKKSKKKSKWVNVNRRRSRNWVWWWFMWIVYLFFLYQDNAPVN